MITKPNLSSDELYKPIYEECRSLISLTFYLETSDIFTKKKKGDDY